MPGPTTHLLPASRMTASLITDGRWIGTHGIGRFAREVLHRLSMENTRVSLRSKPSAPHDAAMLDLHLRRNLARNGLFFSPGYNCPLTRARRSVVTLHDIMHLTAAGGTSSPLKALYYEHIVKPAIRSTGTFMTVSRFSGDAICEWAKMPESAAIVVGNGVSDAFSPEGSRHRHERPYLLYVGNHRPHKNVPRLLQGFAEAGGVGQDLMLLMSGQSSPEVEAMLLTLGLQDRVRFVGQADDAKLAEIYRGAIALVIPSLDEGFGLPAIEAMACGTPVIASSAGALPEVVESAALIVDPLKVDQLADAMRRIVEDTALRSTLSLAGLARAHHFSWDSVAARVNATLRALQRG